MPAGPGDQAVVWAWALEGLQLEPNFAYSEVESDPNFQPPLNTCFWTARLPIVLDTHKHTEERVGD